MDNTKDNMLIAEFMGIKSMTFGTIKKWMVGDKEKENLAFPDDLSYTGELKYHSSWDWLMPVVGKIKKQVIPRKGAETHFSDLFGDILEFNQRKVYTAVIDFIKWFNKQGTGDKL